ncbi:MAG TPA: DUF167 domain-containing protein [Candidatus Saccharimonadia bacterium]|nr:DUF167 domain-containing protein [Candidatus Saccharimonadia bacterium]
MSARFAVRLTPRGGEDRIDGVGDGGELRVRVRAVPEAGAANAALRRLIATSLDVPLSAVAVESGHRGRTKRLHIDGAVAADLARRWPGLAVVDAPDRAVG